MCCVDNRYILEPQERRRRKLSEEEMQMHQLWLKVGDHFMEFQQSKGIERLKQAVDVRLITAPALPVTYSKAR